MNTLQRLARAARMVLENRVTLAVEERAVRKRAARTSATRDVAGHVLLTAPGNGNIGDQAVLESFVRGVDGPVTLIVRRTSDVAGLPPGSEGRVRVLALPGLLYGTPWQAVSSAGRLVGILRGARSFSVVGADIMDGVYWEAPSIRRFRLARIAADLGLPARILGFSWSERATRLAREAMTRTSTTVELCVRDPVSASRLLAAGAAGVTEVADLAFQTRRVALPGELQEWIASRRAEGRTIVALNSNGLIEGLASTVDVYRHVIAHARDDLAFVTVPHASRGTPSDVDLARALGRLVRDPVRLHVVESLLAPGQIAELAAHAELVVTGRMHLTILAATTGTPALTIGYQGKVAGLYASLGIDTWIEVDGRTRERLPESIQHALARAPELRTAVGAALPALLERSLRNLRGLRPAEPRDERVTGREGPAR